MSSVGTPKSPEQIQKDWDTNPRWKGITRTYTPADVVALQGSVVEESTLARRGAEVLWSQLHDLEFVNALGALTGNMAVQQVRAGLKAIYLSGWQVAGDANLSGHTYPDQSLYPANSVPQVVRRINNALLRADQIAKVEGDTSIENWLAPIVADGEAGFGGALNVYELQKAMIAAGVAGSHWEDQLASEKKCGHLGGKVLIPTQQHIRTLTSARLAADVADVPTVVIARTDAEAATLITSDVDERDRPFVTGERTSEGFYRVKNGLEPCIARAKAYAPYSDLIWMETGTPDLDLARQLRRGRQERVPRPAAGLQLLAVVQLAQAPGRLDHRSVPEGARRDGLQVPVHHAGRLPRAELLDVRSGLRLRPQPDERLRRAAGARVRRRGARLHRHQAPARGRCRLLRPDRDHRRPDVVDHRARGLDRRGSVPLTMRGLWPRGGSGTERLSH